MTYPIYNGKKSCYLYLVLCTKNKARTKKIFFLDQILDYYHQQTTTLSATLRIFQFETNFEVFFFSFIHLLHISFFSTNSNFVITIVAVGYFFSLSLCLVTN